MTAKEYLNGIRRLDLRLKTKEAEFSRLEQDITTLKGIDYSKDRVDGGAGGDMGDNIARLIDLQTVLNEEWDELIRRREEARKMIKAMPDEKHLTILLLRYVNNRSWNEIAEFMHYTFRNTTRIHGQALQAFGEKYKVFLEKMSYNVL